MCYEVSNWFLKARAKELHRERERTNESKHAPADRPATEAERPRTDVKEPEKVPA